MLGGAEGRQCLSPEGFWAGPGSFPRQAVLPVPPWPQPLLPQPLFPARPTLTTGLPVRSGLDKEHIEGRRQVSGCLVLLVSLVEGHEQVLLHREGGLQATEEGILFLFGRQFTQEPYQGDSNSKQ